MKMFRYTCSRALRAALTCVVWSASASAQSASLDPEPWTLPAPRPATSDRGSDGVDAHGSKRADHLALGALGGVGFPRPLAVEGLIKLERAVALGVEYSALPQVTVSGVSAKAWAVAGDARVFPLRGAFFLGLRVGEQHLAAQTELSAYGYSAPAALAVDTFFLNPRIGFLWTWDPGVTLGIDAGLQIPLSSSSSSSLSGTPAAIQEAVSSASSSLEGVGKSIGQTPLPTIDFLRVGFLF